MTTVNIHVAKTHFSRWVNEVVDGGEVIIAKNGKPVARLVPFERVDKPRKRALGPLAGIAVVPDAFDSPLSEDLLDAFEGR